MIGCCSVFFFFARKDEPIRDSKRIHVVLGHQIGMFWSSNARNPEREELGERNKCLCLLLCLFVVIHVTYQ